MTAHRSFRFLLLLPVLTTPAAAQRIVGEIVDPAGGSPVAGAFIRLLDEDGRFVRGVLSDSAGRFVLSVNVPGRYRLRAERIGYISAEAGPLDIGADATVPVRLESGMRAIALDAIEVSGERRCATRPERAAGAAQVWDEARKALEITDWARENGGLRYRSTVFSRDLGPRLDVVDQDLRSVVNAGHKSFPTVPLDDLQEHGFARIDGDTIEYFGLDAEILLSDWFLDTHCFELTASDDASLVGLRFRPVRDRGLPDVEGTLWVDRTTGELQWIDYAYLRIDVVLPPLARVERPSDPRIPEIRMTGRTSFRRLDSGVWIVNDWWIRVPVLGHMRGEVHLNGWHERGGVVIETFDLRGADIGPQIRSQRSAARSAQWTDRSLRSDRRPTKPRAARQ